MNKRQRKKRDTRNQEETYKELQLFGSLFFNDRLARFHFWCDRHPRRHWMSPSAYARGRAAFLRQIEAEKVAFRQKLKTHHHTLGGWIPKKERLWENEK